MRKITKLAVQSFLDRKEFQLSNTRVETDEASSSLFLFENKIAILNRQGAMFVSLGGYHYTRTTQERLNALPGVSVRKAKGEVYLNGLKWDGKFVMVN